MREGGSGKETKREWRKEWVCSPSPSRSHIHVRTLFFFPLQDDASVVSLIADATAELERYGATNGVVVAKCRHRQRRRQRRRQRQRQRQRDHTHSFTHSLFHRFSSWFTTPCLPPPTPPLVIALELALGLSRSWSCFLSIFAFHISFPARLFQTMNHNQHEPR